jgi:hypothetical protein
MSSLTILLRRLRLEEVHPTEHRRKIRVIHSKY